MKIVSSFAGLKDADFHGEILVPTMGALHEGHLSLVREGVKRGRRVVVSVFVNPTQFGPNEDFQKYPRDLARDASLLEGAGADLLFAPSTEEMFSERSTRITVDGVADLYEGSIRPGHFSGVATVVAKLFNLCQPSVAIFGLKDLQQCAVIKQMRSSLNFPVELFFAETVRESNGLAMSSRNEYLSTTERNAASAIYDQLKQSRDQIGQGKDGHGVLLSSIEILNNLNFQVDYFDLIDVPTFSPVQDKGAESAIICAVRVGTTRLIDNILLFSSNNMS